jgi:hypothetical protein
MAVSIRKKGMNGPTGTRARRRQERARRRRFQHILASGLAVAIVGGLVALLVWAVLTPQPGEYVSSQGNAHISEAQMGQFTYSTSPPTSGPHLGSLARWGVHGKPIADELQVHNLEDGGVMVQYNCPQGCPDLVAQLEEVVDHYHEGVILAPYPAMEARIALTAWQRIDRLEAYDEERIERFIRAYRGNDHHQ